MSHCPACKGYTGTQQGKPNAYGVYAVERIPCPGCGHEDLERQLAEYEGAEEMFQAGRRAHAEEITAHDEAKRKLAEAQREIQKIEEYHAKCLVVANVHAPVGKVMLIDAVQTLRDWLSEASAKSLRDFHNIEAWHAKWTEQQVILTEAQAALEAFTSHGMADVRALWANGKVCEECSHPLCVSHRGLLIDRDVLQATLERAREAAEAGKDLAGWAAAIKWNHQERNTEEWLAGLRERIEKVQALTVLAGTDPHA